MYHFVNVLCDKILQMLYRGLQKVQKCFTKEWEINMQNVDYQYIIIVSNNFYLSLLKQILKIV